jgi:hypothetical protein
MSMSEPPETDTADVPSLPAAADPDNTQPALEVALTPDEERLCDRATD